MPLSTIQSLQKYQMETIMKAQRRRLIRLNLCHKQTDNIRYK